MPGDRLRQEDLEPLLRRFIDEGDSDAIQRFVAQTRPRLYAIARKIVDAPDAHDVVQEAYLSMFRKGSADLGAPIFGWLITAVVRISYHKKAASKRQLDVLQQLAKPRDADDRPLERLARDEEARIVREEVRRLPAAYRDVLVLHYLQGLGTASIAGLLGVPLPTVKTRLQRGRGLIAPRLASRIALGVFGFLLACGDRARAAGGMFGFVIPASTAAKIALASGVVAVGSLVLAVTWHGGNDAPPRTERIARAQDDAWAVGGEPAKDNLDLSPIADPESDTPASVEVSGNAASSLDAAARSLSVSAEALAAALDAEAKLARGNRMQVAEHRREAEQALSKLRAFPHGDGFRAVVALIRAGRAGQWFEELAGATWIPDLGLEDLLVATADDPHAQASRVRTAIVALGAIDAPRSRDYLITTLPRLEDPMAIVYAARALGKWGERRAAAAVVARLHQENLQAACPHLLAALGGIGGPEAAASLLDFVRHGPRDHLGYALSALAKADRALARTEAASRIAEGVAGLPAPTVAMIERLATE